MDYDAQDLIDRAPDLAAYQLPNVSELSLSSRGADEACPRTKQKHIFVATGH